MKWYFLRVNFENFDGMSIMVKINKKYIGVF